MPNDIIKCPKCGSDIELGAAMQQQMQSALADQLKAETERLNINAQEIIRSSEERLRKESEGKIKELQDREERASAESQQRIKEMEQRTAQARQEADKVKADGEILLANITRDLDIAREKLQAENEIKLAEDRKRVEEETRKRIEDDNILKNAQNAVQMESLRGEVEAYRRKLESASQQLIGEGQEIALEEALKMAFPMDIIEPVQKGMKGADCIQRINGIGNTLGTIVWESKRTKAWLNEWIPKLKDDQRTLNAELAILVTQTLPNGFPTKAGQQDGVWITDFPTAISVATALRAGLIYAASMKSLSSGSDEKSQKLFEYVTSPEFRGNMAAIIETFIAFETDLAAEKRAFEKQCKKRQMTITRALTASHRIYGGLQGLLGEKSMPELETEAPKQIES